MNDERATQRSDKSGQIPKFIKKHKISLIKNKILLRKYGYLFYRRAVSQVLPSEAKKFNELQIKRRVYITWKLFYLDQKVEWRLIVRANLHYAYFLKRTYLKHWQLVLLKTNADRIENRIAILHSLKKLKCKYFYKMLYDVKYCRYYETLREIIMKQIATYCLSLETIAVSHKYVDLKLKYHLQQFFYKKWKQTILKMYFSKLLNYTNNKVVKRNNNLRARSLFKSKTYPEMTRSFFYAWKSYTAKTIKRKLQMRTAFDHFKKKILYQSLLKLCRYKDYRHDKTTKYMLAQENYQNNLRYKYFIRWYNFVCHETLKRTKINHANQFYINKILKKYFVYFVEYYEYKQRKRECMLAIDERFQSKLKIKILRGLKEYSMLSKKSKFAISYYNNKIKFKYFNNLLIFHSDNILRNEMQDNLIKNVLRKHENRIMYHHFMKLKLYRCLQLEKRLKISLAVNKFKMILLEKTLIIWKDFVQEQRVLAEKAKLALASRALTQWITFTKYKILYKNKLKEAMIVYKACLVKKCLNVIVGAAYEKQRIRENQLLETMERTFYLVRKYYKIWQRKVISNKYSIPHVTGERLNLSSLDQEYTSKYVSRGTELFKLANIPSLSQNVKSFEWNSMCFEKPRVPNYLRNSKEDV